MKIKGSYIYLAVVLAVVVWLVWSKKKVAKVVNEPQTGGVKPGYPKRGILGDLPNNFAPQNGGVSQPVSNDLIKIEQVVYPKTIGELINPVKYDINDPRNCPPGFQPHPADMGCVPIGQPIGNYTGFPTIEDLNPISNPLEIKKIYG